MKNRQQTKKKKWITVGIVFALFMLSGLIFAGASVWNEYSQTIIDIQKDQMLNTVDAVVSNLEHEMENYVGDMDHLGNMIRYAQDENNMELAYFALEQYADSKGGDIGALCLRTTDGRSLWSNSGISFTEIYKMTSVKEGITLSERKGDNGELYFVFTKDLGELCAFEMAVSIRSYYEQLLSSIQIGSNGYLVVKTSDGIILMHPEKEQWGISVIEGREELYQVDQLDSLDRMTDDQLQGKTGVAEYESYWWGNEDLPRVRKIAAYAPAHIGADFLVVSAVIDYDEIYRPIFDGFTKIGVIFFFLFFLLLTFIAIFSYLAVQKKKNQEEIAYLRDLNQVLEKTRQSEEAITHQQRLQIMGTMTGGIAHEFNNMLTPIMGYADMLLDMLPSDSEEYEYVQEIFDASDKAKDVIQQISSLSRKNMETVFTFIPVKKLLNRTVKMIHSVAPANVRIMLDETYTKEGFLGNETQMKQVILNLCVNAFHAMGKEKEGQLTICGTIEEREKIEQLQGVQLARDWDSFLCLRISDNGCGMSSETMEQIFTPFFTTKKTGTGTGLGLAIVEQIVHSHKGYLFVKSKLETGSDFYLYLPMAEENTMYEYKMQQKIFSSSDRLNILVVDDNEKILQLLKKEFEKLKLSCQTVETPGEAKTVLKKERYQLILIDRTLGNNHSGINFAMSIQNQYPDMIRILMVDQVNREVMEAVQKNTIHAYIEKPVSGAAIIEKLRTLNELS